jgi:hypothetical protein
MQATAAAQASEKTNNLWLAARDPWSNLAFMIRTTSGLALSLGRCGFDGNNNS